MPEQVFRFCITGLLNTLIDFGFFNLLLLLTGRNDPVALLCINIVSISLAMLNSYILNGRWTFGNFEPGIGQAARFITASLTGMFINTAIVWAVSCLLAGDHMTLWLNLGKGLGAIVSSAWNFFIYRYWVFPARHISRLKKLSPIFNMNPLLEQPCPAMTAGMISIIIPAYNEALRLPGRLQELIAGLSPEIPCEIIVVNDGSEDETLEAVRDWAMRYPFILPLSYKPNKGKGAAVRTGILNASGEYLLFVDADESFSSAHIKACIKELKDGAPIVAACRPAHGRRMEGESLLKYIRGRAFNLMVQALLLPGIEDSQCGLKGFHHDIARELFRRQKIEGFAFDVEILSLASILNYPIRKLPVSLKDCEGSSVRKILTPLQMAWDLLRIKGWILSNRYHLPQHSYDLRPVMIMSGLFCLALIARLPWLYEVPRFIDELKEVELAYQIYQGQIYPLHNIAHDIGALHNYILAGIFALIKPGIYWPRLYVAITSAITVVMVFLIGKRLYGEQSGLIAAFLLLGNGMHCLVSHMAWSNCSTAFFFSLALLTLLKAEDEQKPALFILAAFLWGLTLQTHSSVLIYLLVISLYVLSKGFRQRSMFKLSHYAGALLTLILAYANMIYFNLSSRGGSFSWLGNKGYALEQNPGLASYLVNLQAMVVDLLRTISSTFTSQPDLSSYMSQPLFFLALVLVLLGAILSLREKKALPIFLILGAMLVMPWINKRYVFFVSTRYIMPVVICAILLMAHGTAYLVKKLVHSCRLAPLLKRSITISILMLALLQLLPFYHYCHRIQDTNQSNKLTMNIIQGILKGRSANETLVLLDPELNIENDPLPILLKLSGLNYDLFSSLNIGSVSACTNADPIPAATEAKQVFAIVSEKTYQNTIRQYEPGEVRPYEQHLTLNPGPEDKRRVFVLELSPGLVPVSARSSQP